MALTTAMMIVEIVAGNLFGPMSLLADSWRMAPRGAFSTRNLSIV